MSDKKWNPNQPIRSLWSSAEAELCESDLELRVYSSRLLGQDSTLVLHGGGNTSVKVKELNLVGEEEEILYVKGSGWDLATIEKEGFAPVRLTPMQKLAKLKALSDPEMVNELKTQMILAGAPSPSVETILHAVLPFRFVDHTHADAVVTLTNSVDGEQRVRELYGDKVIVVPYVMPGFDLARQIDEEFSKQKTEKTIGMVLLHHGVFTFSDSAQDSYENMVKLVSMAEEYLQQEDSWSVAQDGGEITAPVGEMRGDIASLRADISAAAGSPMIMQMVQSRAGLNFSNQDRVADIACRGPVTPDHVLRTKRIPMVGRDVTAYGEEYSKYFEQYSPNATEAKTILDPAPRVVLDKSLGLCAVGKSVKDADIVADLYEHTMVCIERAESLGGWRTLPESDIFNLEYWDLEQAKLKKSSATPQFQGEVALVTGAASGIGRACVTSFIARGAVVIGLDIDSSIVDLYPNSQSSFLGIECDIADEDAQRSALEQGVRRFGGIDMVVLNAGLFPGGTHIAELDSKSWRRVLEVNLDSNLALLRESYPLLKLAPNGGRIVVMGSKNVPAPGEGAASYSASKAALVQLMRIAALEWGRDGIRVNALHPDAVFDTGIWSDEVLQSRAQHYGISVAEYKSRNIMGVEVSSRDVAELTAELCGELFAKTTAAQIPIDGGNERVI